jgi:DNA-binding CsgD family transcriptional regulator
MPMPAAMPCWATAGFSAAHWMFWPPPTRRRTRRCGMSSRPPAAAPPDDRWIVHVLPLTSGARRRAGFACAAVAAIFVSKASLDTPSRMETVARLYKLTPSELRVLGAVIDGGGISTVGEALGISDATVKTHLQHLFDKTGMRRQVDLVKLVAGHASPLGNRLTAGCGDAASTVRLIRPPRSLASFASRSILVGSPRSWRMSGRDNPRSVAFAQRFKTKCIERPSAGDLSSDRMTRSHRLSFKHLPMIQTSWAGC